MAGPAPCSIRTCRTRVHSRRASTGSTRPVRPVVLRAAPRPRASRAKLRRSASQASARRSSSASAAVTSLAVVVVRRENFLTGGDKPERGSITNPVTHSLADGAGLPPLDTSRLRATWHRTRPPAAAPTPRAPGIPQRQPQNPGRRNVLRLLPLGRDHDQRRERPGRAGADTADHRLQQRPRPRRHPRRDAGRRHRARRHHRRLRLRPPPS